ncbi:hypothetical protein PoB_006918800 [Plakobranchus ocellatus]|uniref:Secreted protein n=1 Tax=Plakobranchus ocellatus TaxID=259542 RepID=A0AAV4DF41_9GAST|nr:hypothetical protein PoB_006918800 [Plakobranchus ocellatus]
MLCGKFPVSSLKTLALICVRKGLGGLARVSMFGQRSVVNGRHWRWISLRVKDWSKRTRHDLLETSVKRRSANSPSNDQGSFCRGFEPYTCALHLQC